MKIITKFINEDNVNDLKEVFLDLDKRKTGFITTKDLEKALVETGFNAGAEEIKEIVKRVSYLSTGKINYTEFLIATLNFKTQINDQLIYDSF